MQWIVARFSGPNELLLEILSASGALVSSKPLEIAPLELTIPVPIHSDGTNTYLGIGAKLLTVSATGETQTIEFESPIRSIQGSARSTLSRIALSFDRGVRILWSHNGTELGPMICADMYHPQTLFTRIGRLVVVAEDRCEVYNTVRQEITFVGGSKVEPCNRLMQCKESDHVALLTKSGKICVYRIPIS